MRDTLVGATRFEQFGATGIADNILNSRLDLLVGESILERRRYQEHPPRHEYLLTEEGRELLPVVTALGAWGLRWTDTDAPAPVLRHLTCGTVVGLDLWCPACERIAPSRQVEVRPPWAVPDGAAAEPLPAR